MTTDFCDSAPKEVIVELTLPKPTGSGRDYGGESELTNLLKQLQDQDVSVLDKYNTHIVLLLARV